MNQTNIKVDPDDKKMKLDKFVVKKKSSSAQSEEISSYIFLSGLITKLILDCYNLFLSLFDPPSMVLLSCYTASFK